LYILLITSGKKPIDFRESGGILIRWSLNQVFPVVESAPPMPISIVVAQRTALAAQLLCRALKGQRKQFVVVGSVDKPSDLLKQVAEHHPDIAVISSNLEGDPRGGVKVIRALRVSAPSTRPIVLLDCSDSEQVIDAFSGGARGVVCQSEPVQVLCKCIRTVHAGQIWANSRELGWIVKTLGDREPSHMVSAKGFPLLTKREEQIVNMVIDGLPNHEIAAKLGLSAHTVKNHLFHVYEKLGISNRAELGLYAQSGRDGKASS
jgi:DNA-binding NarL/FixJ family response regulator